jgi:hypothetical protein
MKRFSVYGLLLLTFMFVIFLSMKLVSSKDISDRNTSRDTIQQGNSNTEVSPVNSNKSGKCCCNKGCDKSKCSKEDMKNGDVPIGKNPNLNNPDTVKSNITPQEEKK